uniref:Uncharacterized protein n=1 Tax=Schistosoma mansoni TaxID=6183 RepID=A0A3Q0KSM2_SCHMA
MDNYIPNRVVLITNKLQVEMNAGHYFEKIFFTIVLSVLLQSACPKRTLPCGALVA